MVGLMDEDPASKLLPTIIPDRPPPMIATRLGVVDIILCCNEESNGMVDTNLKRIKLCGIGKGEKKIRTTSRCP